jgi:hypothetical protein
VPFDKDLEGHFSFGRRRHGRPDPPRQGRYGWPGHHAR